MAKKKGKTQGVNNIQELNLEIDYDKLAKAIVGAKSEADTIEQYDEDSQEYIYKTVLGKVKRNYFAFSLSKLMACFFYILAIGEVYLTTLIVPQVKSYILNLYSNQNYSTGFVWFMRISSHIAVLTISAAVFCILFNIAREIKREKDRIFVVSAFSGIVSFAALVVALVALFKGVG